MAERMNGWLAAFALLGAVGIGATLEYCAHAVHYGHKHDRP